MIFNTVTGKLLRQMTGHSQTATAIAWNPGWQYVASAGDDFTVRLWDASSGLQVAVLEGHEGPVNDVDWSPDGTYLVSSGNDNRIIIWEVATKQKYLETRVEGRATGIEWSPDGSQIMVEGCQQITNQECRSGIRLLEASAGSELAFMPGKSFSMTQAAWSPVGSQFASAYEEGVILIWKSQPLGEHRHVHQIAHVLDEQTLGAGFGLEDDIGTP